MKSFLSIVLLLYFLNTGSAHSASIEIPTDASLKISIDWFDAAKCSGAGSPNFHFKFGERTYRVNPKDVNFGVLKRLSMRKESGRLLAKVPEASGCKSSPMPLALISLKSHSNELSRDVDFAEVAKRKSELPRVTQYIHHLGKKGACKTTQFPRLIHCVGGRDGGKVRLDFLVLADDNGKIGLTESRIPIHARCESDAKVKLKCSVREVFGGDVSLASGTELQGMNAARLQAIHKGILVLEKRLRQP